MANPSLYPGYPKSASSTNAAAVSPSFTPPANALLVVIGWMSENYTLSIADSSGLTWTQQAVTSSYPKVYIWTAVSGSSPAAMTVTVTPGTLSGSAAVVVYVLDNADTASFGATNQKSETLKNAPYSLSVTPGASDSLLIAGFAASQNSALGVVTGTSTTTMDGTKSSTTNTRQFGFGHNANALTGGSAYALDWTLASGNGIRDTACALEVKTGPALPPPGGGARPLVMCIT